MSSEQTQTAPADASSTASVSWSLTKEAVETHVDEVIRDCSTVKKLMKAMQEIGCSVPRSYFTVVACDTKTGGGFSIEHGVVLCHNQLQSYTDVESTMAHELVHAFDYYRTPSMDFKDCAQHACSEVRAANLSGDCTLMQEFLRGNLSLTQPSTLLGLRERCVRRRAALSVAMNPGCGGLKGAAVAVDKILARCMSDCEPLN